MPPWSWPFVAAVAAWTLLAPREHGSASGRFRTNFSLLRVAARASTSRSPRAKQCEHPSLPVTQRPYRAIASDLPLRRRSSETSRGEPLHLAVASSFVALRHSITRDQYTERAHVPARGAYHLMADKPIAAVDQPCLTSRRKRRRRPSTGMPVKASPSSCCRATCTECCDGHEAFAHACTACNGP